jgi:hypothetical protein
VFGLLTAFHCGQIGLFALLNMKDLEEEAVQWIQLAVRKTDEQNDHTIPLPVLQNYLEIAVGMMVDFFILWSFVL